MLLEPEELVQGLPRLASCSHVYEGLCNALNNPKASVSDFADIIGNDPDLTARLLQLANSAFYGYPRGIKSVSEAVIMIGVQQVRDLVASTAVIEYFKGVSSDWVNMTSFWEHSLACGISARILAGYHRRSNPEQIFAAGLMHDLGRLVLLIREPNSSRDVFNTHTTSGKSLLQSEFETLGFDHADVGAALLEAWGLPELLIDAVKYHHNPMGATRDPFNASIIHCGNVIAHALEYGSSGERHISNYDPRAWTRLNLDAELLRNIVKEVDRQFADVVGIFVHWIIAKNPNGT